MRMRIMMFIGTVAIAITITGSKWIEGGADSESATVSANAYTEAVKLPSGQPDVDPYHRLLGVASDRELYDALYGGRTLAELAEANGVDPEAVVNLQVEELSKQLDSRLRDGSITPGAHKAQLAELNEIVSRGVYGTA